MPASLAIFMVRNITNIAYIDLNHKISERLLTFARTFSNEAGLTREKQIKNTSYKEREGEKNKDKILISC